MLRKRKRQIGYARVSAGIQEDGTSLDTQTSAIINLAKSMGYEIGPEDVLREVKTGVTVDRPVLDEIRGMAAADELSALFVYSTDRFSRDPVDLLVLIREFKRPRCGSPLRARAFGFFSIRRVGEVRTRVLGRVRSTPRSGSGPGMAG